MLQLDGDIVYLLQSFRTKEIRRIVVGLQHPFVFGRDHGRQLCQVANHQQLHAAKGLVMFAETSQNGIDGIEQIGSYH